MDRRENRLMWRACTDHTGHPVPRGQGDLRPSQRADKVHPAREAKIPPGPSRRRLRRRRARELRLIQSRANHGISVSKITVMGVALTYFRLGTNSRRRLFMVTIALSRRGIGLTEPAIHLKKTSCVSVTGFCTAMPLFKTAFRFYAQSNEHRLASARSPEGSSFSGVICIRRRGPRKQGSHRAA